MKKVLIIVGKMTNGGVESFCLNFAEKLTDKYDITFLAYSNSPCIPYERISKMNAKVELISPITKYLHFKNDLKKILKITKYDIVHCNMNTLNPIFLKICKKYGIENCISHCHSTSNKKEIVRNIIKNFLRIFSRKYATKLVACSQYVGEWTFGKKANFDIVPNGINFELFQFNTNYEKVIKKKLNLENQILIGHIGRLCKQKNQNFVLNIAKIAQSRSLNWRFLLIGDGDDEIKIKSRIEKEDLNNVILLHSTDEIYKYYSAFDCLILPSLYEGFGICLLEAQVNGLPCIKSNFINEEPVFSDSVVTLPINKGDENKWLENIEKLISKRNKIVISHDKIKKFSTDETANTINRIYSEI